MTSPPLRYRLALLAIMLLGVCVCVGFGEYGIGAVLLGATVWAATGFRGT